MFSALYKMADMKRGYFDTGDGQKRGYFDTDEGQKRGYFDTKI